MGIWQEKRSRRIFTIFIRKKLSLAANVRQLQAMKARRSVGDFCDLRISFLCFRAALRKIDFFCGSFHCASAVVHLESFARNFYRSQFNEENRIQLKNNQSGLDEVPASPYRSNFCGVPQRVKLCASSRHNSYK